MSVPLLLEGLLPDPGRLPDLVLALAKDVDWDHPRERAQTIAWVGSGAVVGGWGKAEFLEVVMTGKAQRL